MAQRGGRTEVELVEDDDVLDTRPHRGRGGRAPGRDDGRHGPQHGPGGERGSADDHAGEDDDAPAPPRPGARRRRRLRTAVGAALVLVLVGAQVATSASERAEVAALRALPGVRGPLPATLAETWRVPGDRLPVALGTGLDPLAGPLLGLRQTPTGVDLVALDPPTGADAWVRPLTSAPADVAEALGTPLPRCAPVGRTPARPSPARPSPARPADAGTATGRPAEVVCLVTDAWTRDGGVVVQDVPATTSRLLRVRTDDGSVRADHVVDATPGVPATSFALLGDVAVLGYPLDAGALLVRGVDAVTGEERWWRDGRPGDVLPGAPAVVHGTDGVVAVPRGATLQLLDADGRPVRPVRLREGGALHEHVDARGTSRLVVQEGPHARLVTAARTGRLPGPPATVTVDDGSAGDLLLAASAEGLHALEGPDLRQRWSVPVGDVQQVLVLRGRVHAVAPDGVRTYDARTGEPVWQRTHDARDEVPAGPVGTDGEVLHVPVADEEGGEVARVLRLGVADGRAADEPVAVPAGLLTVRVGHDVVLGWRTDGDVTALR
ncbi:hypothetical protein ACFUMH_12965 [Cellulomonas sp. NPDC057328]|uniref:hypothetical protein n=1 Tax=Cellulomonas sp. NPDC057328 TaxID=3346101 RepID=UPI00363B682E